jgi:ParB family chromosome partitioning protein
LAESIRSAGLIQPIVVRPVIGSAGRFELIAGERRLRACKSLKWHEIPAIVTNATDQDSGVWALIENVHRTDLNPMDRAAALQRLITEFRMTHEALAEQVGIDRSTVTNLLRLMELDPPTADLVRKGHLSQGHAKVLLAISNQKTRSSVAESAVRGDWSVRALEREVQRLNDPSDQVPRGTQSNRRRSNIESLERKLSRALGTDVAIQTGKKPNTGKMTIAFYSIEQFEGLASRMGVNTTDLNREDGL